MHTPEEAKDASGHNAIAGLVAYYTAIIQGQLGTLSALRARVAELEQPPKGEAPPA